MLARISLKVAAKKCQAVLSATKRTPDAGAHTSSAKGYSACNAFVEDEATQRCPCVYPSTTRSQEALKPTRHRRPTRAIDRP
jgi:hypothetical protein